MITLRRSSERGHANTVADVRDVPEIARLPRRTVVEREGTAQVPFDVVLVPRDPRDEPRSLVVGIDVRRRSDQRVTAQCPG